MRGSHHGVTVMALVPLLLLIVTQSTANPHGSGTTLADELPIPDTPPTAVANVTPLEGYIFITSFTFDGTGSWDDGSIVSYEWAFGDGYTAVGPTASHTYSSKGVWNGALIVTDDEGAQSFAPFTVTIKNRTPVINGVGGRGGHLGTAHTLEVTATDPEGDWLYYTWSQDSGPPVLIQGADEPTARFIPTVGGDYVFRIAVSDGSGANETTVNVTVVSNHPPEVTASPFNPAVSMSAGERMTFHVNAYDADGDYLIYNWTVDGSPSDAHTPNTEFNPRLPGTYALKVTVSDGYVETAHEWTVTVGPRESAAPGELPLIGIVAVALAAVIATLGIYLALLWLRKSGSGSRPTPPAPPRAPPP
ncbi:MAG TPA: PKD domain-containing protein [Thermoplasmata archaeon]|nr:PKD domain-containing protein [Thermoplasmata archaeon]